MSKYRKAYSPEYRRRMVDLVRAGRSPEDLAREFEPTSVSIRHWVVQAGIDEGKTAGLTTDERKELAELRRENRLLREEREILKKATAWFAQEAGVAPSRRLNS